jgi:hypothetical protein
MSKPSGNVVACFVAAMPLTSGNFLKPLNPLLGETLQTEYGDGSKLWMEQTCHHPPVAAFYLEAAVSKKRQLNW